MQTIFDIFGDLFTKKSKGTLCNDPNFNSIMNNFMICRLLRMGDDYVKIAAEVSPFISVWSKKEMYLFLFVNLPKKQRAPFFKYISPPKKKKEEEKTIRKDKEGFFSL